MHTFLMILFIIEAATSAIAFMAMILCVLIGRTENLSPGRIMWAIFFPMLRSSIAALAAINFDSRLAFWSAILFAFFNGAICLRNMISNSIVSSIINFSMMALFIVGEATF